MKELLDKLTTYNIFNFLFPGILFVLLVKPTAGYDFIQDNNLLGAFFYYFIGMTISRFGSVVIEPLLKKIKVIEFREYKDFINASKSDLKIDLLSEVNNIYRTIISMLILVGLINLYSAFVTLNNSISLIILGILITALYLFSYRKQTKFIVKRIDNNLKS
jgi:hypothetical protein